MNECKIVTDLLPTYCDDLTDEAAGLTADVALAVNQQLVQEGQSLLFLAGGQIGEVLAEDVQIGPQLLPVLGRAG